MRVARHAARFSWCRRRAFWSFEARPDGDRCPLRLLCSRISQQTSRPDLKSTASARMRDHVVRLRSLLRIRPTSDLLPISFSKSDCEPALLHKNPQQRYTVFTSFDARIKFFKFHRVIFPGINAAVIYQPAGCPGHVPEDTQRVYMPLLRNLWWDELPPSRVDNTAVSFTALLASLIIQTR